MTHFMTHFPSDMDANCDDLITVFEYGTYVKDCNMLDRFEEMWLACAPFDDARDRRKEQTQKQSLTDTDTQTNT